MSTHNICFYGELMEIIVQLSSNTLLTSSTVTVNALVTCTSADPGFLDRGFKVAKWGFNLIR